MLSRGFTGAITDFGTPPATWRQCIFSCVPASAVLGACVGAWVAR